MLLFIIVGEDHVRNQRLATIPNGQKEREVRHHFGHSMGGDRILRAKHAAPETTSNLRRPPINSKVSVIWIFRVPALETVAEFEYVELPLGFGQD
jgi:hypothetical protein